MIPLSTPPGTKIVCVKPGGLYVMDGGSTFRLREGGEYTLVCFVNDADTGGSDPNLWFVSLAETDPDYVFGRCTFRLRDLPTCLIACLDRQPLIDAEDREFTEIEGATVAAVVARRLVGLSRSGVP